MFLGRVTQRRRLCVWEKAREDAEKCGRGCWEEVEKEREADAEQLFKATRD